MDHDARPDRAAAEQAASSDFVRLDGSVPQKQRPSWSTAFRTRPDCRLFLTTNAGSTGLNLQAANTVINVDLPWNPAVLEQRIARAHRMGQKQPVQVFVLVTEQTIEENLLATIAAKKDLALAALDAESDVDEVDLASGMEELKGPVGSAVGGAARGAGRSVHTSGRASSKCEEFADEHRERVAAAGGELLGAAFKLLGELVSPQTAAEPPQTLVAALRAGLGSFVSDGSSGKPQSNNHPSGRGGARHAGPDARPVAGGWEGAYGCREPSGTLSEGGNSASTWSGSARQTYGEENNSSIACSSRGKRKSKCSCASRLEMT